MRKKLFGTDGIRAVAGRFPLDQPTISRVGHALVGLLEAKGMGAKVLIGRDTRESGPWMERALARGVRADGGEAVSAGVIPTSAVSYLTKTHGFSAGAVISASHNPFRDNGIKVFSPLGIKIPDEWELELEADVLDSRGRLPGHEEAVPEDPRLAGDYAGYLAGRVTRSEKGIRHQGGRRLCQRRQLARRAARPPRGGLRGRSAPRLPGRDAHQPRLRVPPSRTAGRAGPRERRGPGRRLRRGRRPRPLGGRDGPPPQRRPHAGSGHRVSIPLPTGYEGAFVARFVGEDKPAGT